MSPHSILTQAPDRANPSSTDGPEPSYWHGCYEDGWKDLISPESFAHPAKFSRSLIRKIITYALSQGYIKPGDTVLDPFGGVGLGALDSTIHGLNYVGVELEPRFVDMGAGCHCTGISKDEWIRFYGRWDKANHKDGRHWCPKCLSDARLIIDKAPQLSLFEEQDKTASYVRDSGQIPHTIPHYYQGNLDRFRSFGATKENVSARLLQGDSRKLIQVLVENEILDPTAVMKSPPWADQNACNDPDYRVDRQSQGGPLHGDYGDSEGQMARMAEGDSMAVISSPPYAKTNVGLGDPDNEMKRLQAKAAKGELTGEHLRLAQKGKFNSNTQANLDSYGDTPGQLANLPEGIHIITSPPFAGNSGGRGEASREGIDAALFDRHSGGMIGGMGQEDDNLGNLPMKDSDFKAVMKSPPYAGMRTEKNSSSIDIEKNFESYKAAGGGMDFEGYRRLQEKHSGDYGNSPGQLSQLPEGSPQAVVSSPPYAATKPHQHAQGVDLRKKYETYRKHGGGVDFETYVQKEMKTSHDYGDSDGQLSKLPEGNPAAVISSPPFVESVGSDDPDKRGGLYRDPKRRNDRNLTGTYGQSDGQLGMMAEGEMGIISSPPYEESINQSVGANDTEARIHRMKKAGIDVNQRVNVGGNNGVARQDQVYGQTPGQLGADSGTTFWSAARLIVDQCYQILPETGVAIWVTKRFVRNGEIVEFSDMWRELCESVGFVHVETHRALLVKDQGTQIGLNGVSVRKTKERKSFFRRLHEKRHPETRIDWEDVIIMRKD